MVADLIVCLYLIFLIAWCIFSFNDKAWNWLFPYYWKAQYYTNKLLVGVG